MQYFTRILFLLVLLILFSCSGQNGEHRKLKLIPEEELVALMTDLYLADGLLGFPPVRNKFSAKDSIANYIDVVNSHGFTKEQMDMTMKHYFMQKPKDLQKIYDQVLARLSEMQSSFEVAVSDTASKNLWNQKDRLSVPESGSHDLLYFSIPVKDTGLYEISFTALIYNDDRSLNPRATAFFWHDSETQDGERNYWDNINLIRDGTPHNYSISRLHSDTAFTHICGWLFQCDPQPGSWVKHGTFSAVSVRKILRNIE